METLLKAMFIAQLQDYFTFHTSVMVYELNLLQVLEFSFGHFPFVSPLEDSYLVTRPTKNI